MNALRGKGRCGVVAAFYLCDPCLNASEASFSQWSAIQIQLPLPFSFYTQNFSGLLALAEFCTPIFKYAPSPLITHTNVPETDANIINVRPCLVIFSIPSGSCGFNLDMSIFGCGLFHSGNSSSSSSSSSAS